jgi:hypothetical protein
MNSIGKKLLRTKSIKKLYKDLYSAKTLTILNDNDFYRQCVKLTNDQAQYLENKVILAELTAALKTCKNFSPGPDSIPYDVYKSLWHTPSVGTPDRGMLVVLTG